MRVNRLLFRVLSLLLLSNLLVYVAYCQSFNLVGTASSMGSNCYELTGGGTNQKGAIWSTTPIDISQPFDMTFHVRFPVWGADGLAFVLQNDPAGINAISVDPGNTIGAYRRLPGCTGPIPPCPGTSRRGVEPGIAFELDMWNNSGAGSDDITAPSGCCKDDHMSVINTMEPDNAILGPVPAMFDTVDFTDGVCRRMHIRWDPTTQLIEFDYGNFGTLSGNYDIINNIFGGVSTVYWGFTGSSGGVASNFQVCMENLTDLPADTAMCPGTPITLTANALPGGSLSYDWVPTSACDCYNSLQTCVGTCNAFCSAFGAGCPTCNAGTYTFNPAFPDTCTYLIDVTNGIGCRDTHTVEIRGDCILPIELMSFNAFPKEFQSFLEWTTISESQSSHFEVQRSSDGQSFFTIGDVPAVGYSSEERQYEYVDPFPELGLNYYRLKLVDLDGKSSLSEVQMVQFDAPAENGIWKVFPNPSQGTVFFQIALKETAFVGIQIFNSNGGQVLTKGMDGISSGITNLELELNSLPSGLFFYKVQIGGDSFVGKLILAR